MASNRSLGRDTFVYDGQDRDVLLGGLKLNPGVTKANFYAMLEIILIFQRNYSIIDENDILIEKNDEPLSPGSYYVLGRL